MLSLTANKYANPELLLSCCQDMPTVIVVTVTVVYTYTLTIVVGPTFSLLYYRQLPPFIKAVI